MLESTCFALTMERLGELETWTEVQRFFTAAEERRLTTKDLEEFENLEAMKRFRMNASFDAPGYDLNRRSIQSVAVDWYERNRSYLYARERLAEENEKRLMMGFRTACRELLGPDWENESDFLRLEANRSEAYQHGMNRALGEKDNPFLKKELVKADVSPHVHRAIVRNWTNPDFPLWLMTKRALSQSIRYLAGFGDLTEESVDTTLRRLGLVRLKQRPIRVITFSTKRSRNFTGYEFVGYLKELDGIPVVSRGREETRSIRLDGRHFLCADKFPVGRPARPGASRRTSCQPSLQRRH